MISHPKEEYIMQNTMVVVIGVRGWWEWPLGKKLRFRGGVKKEKGKKEKKCIKHGVKGLKLHFGL